MAEQKPAGWNAFNSLARKVAKADKAAVDKQVAKTAKARKQKRKK